MSHVAAQTFALFFGGCGLAMLISIVLMLIEIRQAMRDAHKPRFTGNIPCADCGDREPLDSLSQCPDCGRLFCRNCLNPMWELARRLECEKCEEERRQKCDAAFPHEFAKSQTAIYGVPPEDATND